jgi:hypothetical protein
VRTTCNNNAPKVGKRMNQIVEAVRKLSDGHGGGAFIADAIREAYPDRKHGNGFCYAAVARCVNAGLLVTSDGLCPATNRWLKTLHLPTEGAQSEADWQRECEARIATLNADAAARAEHASRQAAEVVTRIAIAIERTLPR